MTDTSYVLAFDIYGTLLDTSKIATALEKTLGLDGATAGQLSALWRRYQLEYTWRLNSMQIYEPFDVVTRKSFIHATKEFDLLLDEKKTELLMDAYNELPSFEDAITTLEGLKQADLARVLVFSNGAEKMVRSALKAGSLDLLPSGIYVADTVQKFKPAPEIYKGLLGSVGKAKSPGQCFLVSGNPFDVVGARAQGMSAIWVDRARKGWADKLGLEPTKVVHSLTEIADYLRSLP